MAGALFSAAVGGVAVAVFAQAAAPAIGATELSGWTGTGILGGMISWLMLKFIPSLQAEIAAARTEFLNAQNLMQAKFDTTLLRIEQRFDSALKEIMRDREGE